MRSKVNGNRVPEKIWENRAKAIFDDFSKTDKIPKHIRVKLPNKKKTKNRS